jgi:homoserine O-acetyltransferase
MNLADNQLWQTLTGTMETILNKDKSPDKGLSVARMAAHITYLSKNGLQEKFGRKLQERDDLKFGFDADFKLKVI